MLPDWIPECIALPAVRAVGIALSVALFPFLVGAALAEVLTAIDPRLEDL